MQFLRIVASLILLGGACAANAAQRSEVPATSEFACPETRPVYATPPDEPNGGPWKHGLFYVNEEKTIWHVVDIRGPISGQEGNKTAWLRPWGAQLTIAGRRLDAASEPLRAHIPAGYRTGLQIASVYFPTAGCWEVTATAADSTLTFVTKVN